MGRRRRRGRAAVEPGGVNGAPAALSQQTEAAAEEDPTPPPSQGLRPPEDAAPALKRRLLGLIRGFYLDAISRLPTADLRATLARGLLVGGHCSGPLHPAHNAKMPCSGRSLSVPYEPTVRFCIQIRATAHVISYFQVLLLFQRTVFLPPLSLSLAPVTAAFLAAAAALLAAARSRIIFSLLSAAASPFSPHFIGCSFLFSISAAGMSSSRRSLISSHSPLSSPLTTAPSVAGPPRPTTPGSGGYWQEAMDP